MDIGYDRFEIQHRCKDGRNIDMEVCVNFMPVQGGTLIMYLHDITERKRTLDALRENEESFRATFEQAAVGITHVALDGRWLRVNQSSRPTT